MFADGYEGRVGIVNFVSPCVSPGQSKMGALLMKLLEQAIDERRFARLRRLLMTWDKTPAWS
jgi:hypothetical protein